jgi:dihydrofolate synthase/folylpolyglutamate synthase
VTLRLQRALERLYGFERSKSRLGLGGTERLLEALGRPQDRFRAVHVGGTNGKGSVCALIERALRASGIRTGLFTSPHLVDFRERIRVAGRWADAERLDRRLDLIQGLPASPDRTFFEVTTALGFDAFAAADVEWAVVEVGLGGRLDTTNVLRPAVAVITRVGLDHTEILGTTLEAVAAEKAGIIKPGVPVVAATQDPRVIAVLDATARERGAPLVLARDRVRCGRHVLGPKGARFAVEVEPWGALELEIGLRGRHQLENAAAALAALAVLAEDTPVITAETVRLGFAAARWPGRLEPCPGEPRLWWDGAHNPDGVVDLTRAWREDLGFDPPAAIVLAVSRDKDTAPMLAALRALAPRAHLVVTRADDERALAAEALKERAARAGWEVEAAPDVAAAVRAALVAAKTGRVLLAGSLFAVGEAMEAMGGAPGEQL